MLFGQVVHVIEDGIEYLTRLFETLDHLRKMLEKAIQVGELLRGLTKLTHRLGLLALELSNSTHWAKGGCPRKIA